jgi:hypothetical protein
MDYVLLLMQWAAMVGYHAWGEIVFGLQWESRWTAGYCCNRSEVADCCCWIIAEN